MKDIHIKIRFECISIIHEENLNLPENDITVKRFKYIECLISNNGKLFRLKLYLRLTTYTIIDLSD